MLLIKDLVRFHGCKITGQSYRRILVSTDVYFSIIMGSDDTQSTILIVLHLCSLKDSATKLYRMDVSSKVQCAAIQLIDAVIVSEKNFRASATTTKLLSDFAKDVVAPLLHSIINVYKQNRKKYGSTVGASVLKTIGKELDSCGKWS